MSILNLNGPTPQFNKADYSQPNTDICKFCGLTIGGSYYRVNEAMACGSCAEKVRLEKPKDSGNFIRALLFGSVGAFLGLVLYAGFVILTDIIIGYLALAVGFMVAKAMLIGSKGVGGRKYQIAAVLLTYAAVSLSAIPISVAYFMKGKNAQQQIRVKQVGSEPTQADPQAKTASAPQKSLGVLLGYLLLVGLASPFFALSAGFSGVIGLVILFVGIRIAWKMAEGRPATVVEGPFQVSAAAGAR